MGLTKVKYQKEGAIGTITLNRPEKMNAFDEELLSQWRQLMEQVEKDEEVSVLIVTGAGRAWSAGVDLSVFERVKVIPGYEIYEDGAEIINILTRMPQVAICMLNGFCFTGATEMMLAFDLIVAADTAKIGDTHAKWGIPPKWGMTQRLMHQVGIRKAKELSFTAKAITGVEAARIGLVNKSVPLEELQSTVDALAADILANSKQTIAAVKHLYQYGSTHTLDEGLAYERDYEIEFTDKVDDLKDFKNKI